MSFGQAMLMTIILPLAAGIEMLAEGLQKLAAFFARLSAQIALTQARKGRIESAKKILADSEFSAMLPKQLRLNLQLAVDFHEAVKDQPSLPGYKVPTTV